MTPAMSRNYLAITFGRAYTEISTFAAARLIPIWGNGATAADPVQFVNALAQANAGAGCHEPGWRLVDRMQWNA